MMRKTGTVIAIMNSPTYPYDARQLCVAAISEMIWMLIAPPTGRAMPLMARVTPRRRRKKLTVAARGTIPIRKGLLMVLATIYAAKNGHGVLVLTAEIASNAHPTTTSPTVVRTLGPYRSASAPANGANIPESQVPAVTAMDRVPISHPVSSTMYT